VAESTAGSNSTPQGGAGVPTIPNPTPPWSRATESWDARPPGAIAPDRPPALFPAIARAEWQALLLVGAVILLLTQVPPTVERLAGPTDRIHLGNYWYHEDFSAYRAAMLEGERTTSWLIHNPATAESHHPALMFPLYVALGKLAATTGLPDLAVFAAAENVTRVLLIATLYVFVATFLPSARGRRLAFVLAICSGGLTLFLVPILESVGVRTTLAGQPSVQVVTFGLLFTAPHLGLALVMTLSALICIQPAFRGHRGALCMIAVAIVSLALLHPFNLPTVLATIAVFFLARVIRDRTITANGLLTGLVAGVAGAPLLLYNFVTFTLDPFWSKTHGEANTLPSPRPWELPMDYGVVFILTIVALWQLWRRRSRSAPVDGQPANAVILLSWLATGTVCMYLPLAYQHRLAFGLQPAMAVLAAVGWPTAHDALRRFSTRWLRARRSLATAAANVSLIVPALSLPLTVYGALAISAATNRPIHLYGIDRNTYAVGEWLAANTGPDDVTIGAVTTGDVLSGILPGRVALARRAGTIDFASKERNMEAMYQGELSNDSLLRFLRANRVSYIIVGPEERQIGLNDPGSQLGLPIAARDGSAVAYRLRADTAADGG